MKKCEAQDSLVLHFGSTDASSTLDCSTIRCSRRFHDSLCVCVCVVSLPQPAAGIAAPARRKRRHESLESCCLQVRRNRGSSLLCGPGPGAPAARPISYYKPISVYERMRLEGGGGGVAPPHPQSRLVPVWDVGPSGAIGAPFLLCRGDGAGWYQTNVPKRENGLHLRVEWQRCSQTPVALQTEGD